MQHKDTGHEGQTKTMKVVGLFAAAALAVAATGCSSQPAQQPVPISQGAPSQSEVTVNSDDICEDDNNDGYCDSNTSTRVHSGGAFVYIAGKKYYYKDGRAPVVQSQKQQEQNSGSSGGSSSGGSKKGTSVGSGSTVTPPSSSSGSGQVVSTSKSSSSSSSVSSGSRGGVGSSGGSSSS